MGRHGTTLVHDAQAILPEPEDEPTPKPDDVPEPDDEADDDPGTLYFGRRLMEGPIPLQPKRTPQPPGGADTAGPAGSIPL